MKKKRKIKTFEASLSKFSDEFMSERKQPPLQERAAVGAGFKPARFESARGKAEWRISERAGLKPAPTKDLPYGWTWKMLGEIADINPRLDKSRISDDAVVSFVPMPAVGAGDGQIDVSQVKSAKEVKKGYTPFQEGDVLFAKITPCMENGKMAIVPKLTGGFGFGSTEFHVLRPYGAVDSRYIYYFVTSKTFRREAAHNMTGAVGQKRVSTSYLTACPIPVAPLFQQKPIVAEIEKQFSRLDEAVAGLKRIKANLKRYKASVLKAAVEGKLTEEWRKAHSNVETGTELLKRILAERKKKWEEKNPGKKYKEPVVPDTSQLPELPKGWVWASFDQVTVRVTKGSSPNWQGFEYSNEGIPFVRSQNVGWGSTDLSHLAFLPPAFNEIEKKSVLREGDVLLNIVGASIGRSAIAPKAVEGGNVNQAVSVIRLLDDGIKNHYTLIYLLSASTQRRIHLEKVDVARANLSLEDIKVMPVALPPLIEQVAIIEEVERCRSVAEEIEAALDGNLKRAEHLRQAILKKAFSGKLVLQELSRETAGKLIR